METNYASSSDSDTDIERDYGPPIKRNKVESEFTKFVYELSIVEKSIDDIVARGCSSATLKRLMCHKMWSEFFLAMFNQSGKLEKVFRECPLDQLKPLRQFFGVPPGEIRSVVVFCGEPMNRGQELKRTLMSQPKPDIFATNAVPLKVGRGLYLADWQKFWPAALRHARKISGSVIMNLVVVGSVKTGTKMTKDGALHIGEDAANDLSEEVLRKLLTDMS